MKKNSFALALIIFSSNLLLGSLINSVDPLHEDAEILAHFFQCVGKSSAGGDYTEVDSPPYSQATTKSPNSSKKRPGDRPLSITPKKSKKNDGTASSKNKKRTRTASTTRQFDKINTTKSHDIEKFIEKRINEGGSLEDLIVKFHTLMDKDGEFCYRLHSSYTKNGSVFNAIKSFIYIKGITNEQLRKARLLTGLILIDNNSSKLKTLEGWTSINTRASKTKLEEGWTLTEYAVNTYQLALLEFSLKENIPFDEQKIRDVIKKRRRKGVSILMKQYLEKNRTPEVAS